MNKKIILTLIILTIIICTNTSIAQENTTTTTIDVQTYTQLSNKIDNIKNSNITTYEINLKKDNYTINNDIRWMHDENKKLPNLIINGHGCTINGSDTNVFLKTGRNTNLTLNNMTISNTYDNTYSAIYNMGNLTLNNVIFQNNKISSLSILGGGAINNNGNLEINNSTFINNTAVYGGAIFNLKTDFNNAHITINNSNFINNTAENGSCIYSSDAKLITINNTNFTSNNAIDSMIYSNYRTQQITIENSNITDNTNTLALINSQSNIEIINSTIKSNKNTNGALIKTTKSSIINSQICQNIIDILLDANFNDVEIKNSNISENNIKNIAINNINSQIYIQNNTFYRNIVKNQALIYDTSKTTNVENNLFKDNKALNLFYGNCSTFNVVVDNTYIGNNLTNTTIKLDIKDEYMADENITANITVMTNPVYNTTITTGTIKISYNGIIIDTATITNSTYQLNKNIDYVGVLPLTIEYCDDINFNSYKINKTTAIISPSYHIKIVADDEFNLKDEIKYSIIVENQNNKTLHNITIYDVIAQNLDVIDTSHKLDENSWIIEKLTPGENRALMIKAYAKNPTDVMIKLSCDMRFVKNTSTTTCNIKYKAPNYIIKVTPTQYRYGDKVCDFQIQNTGGVGYNINISLDLASKDRKTRKTYTYNQIISNETITIKPDICIEDIGNITTTIKIEDEQLNNNTIILTHNIEKPYIVFDDIYSNAGGNVNITARVENINAGNIKVKSVFKLNSKTIPGVIRYTTDGNVIVLNYNISTSIKNQENRLDVVCDIKDYDVLRNSSKLYIVKLKTKLHLQENIKITPGVKTKFKIYLVDENNNPVIKGRVVLKINKKTLTNSDGKKIYVNITGGIGEFTYMIPYDFVNSEYRFDVIYGENNMYNGCSANTKLKIIKQDIIVEILNSTYMVGDKFMVFIDIKANNTKLPIYGGNYALKINSKTLLDKVHLTNSSISVCFDNLNFSSINSITFCYSGNSAYNSKKVVENLNLLTDSRNLIINDEEFTKIH